MVMGFGGRMEGRFDRVGQQRITPGAEALRAVGEASNVGLEQAPGSRPPGARVARGVESPVTDIDRRGRVGADPPVFVVLPRLRNT